MSAYVIADIALSDAAAYEDYKARSPAIIARHGGEYLVRGGAHEVIEGDWHPTRLVLLRFPDRAAIHAFLADPEYAPLKALRARVATSDLVAVDGLG
jgi:uncharacterized protein (DUF1330 family)